MYTVSNKIMFIVSEQREYLYFVNACFNYHNIISNDSVN